MSELRRLMREFLWEEDAVGVVMIFKDQLTSLVKNILSKITKQSNSI